MSNDQSKANNKVGVISMMSSVVADRITSLIRTDGNQRAAKSETYRVVVALAPPSNSASDGTPVPVGKDFKLALVDKRSSEHVHAVVRSWPIIKQVVLFIRGVAPKLDVPPLPVEAANSAAAVIAEDRRKFLQTYVNAALQHQTVSNLKEFLDLIGLTEFQALHAHDSGVISSASTSIRNSNSSAELASSVTNTSFSPSQARGKLPTVVTPSANSAGGHQENFSPLLEACFRVLDDGGAGYLTPDEMKNFFDVVIQLTPRAKSSIARVQKEARAFSASDFSETILSIAKESNSSSTAVKQWIDEYHHKYYAKIYSAIAGLSTGHTDQSSNNYDLFELRTLLFVLRCSGLRIITENEVKAEQDLSLPISIVDFQRLVDVLVEAVPFDDLIRSLEKSSRGDHHLKTLTIVSKYAATASKEVLTKLQALIAELGGGPRRLGKCGNCETTEQRFRALKLSHGELEEENASLKEEVNSLQDQLAVKDQEFADAASQATTIISLEDEVASLKERLADAETRVSSLSERLKELEGDDEVAPVQVVAPTSVNVFEIHPQHLGSTDSPVVDKAGPITVTLDHTTVFQPSYFQFDLYLVEARGCEYMCCRDGSGKRSFALRIENGVASLQTTARHMNRCHSIDLPLQQWLRWTVRFDWNGKATSVACNGSTVWPDAPFRDADNVVNGVQVLDVYPRHIVMVSYANFRFGD